jgi:hypothetical protein
MNLEIKGDIKFSRYVVIVYSCPSCYKTYLKKNFIIIFLSTFVDKLAKKTNKHIKKITIIFLSTFVDTFVKKN